MVEGEGGDWYRVELVCWSEMLVDHRLTTRTGNRLRSGAKPPCKGAGSAQHSTRNGNNDSMQSSRWQVIAQSEHRWEREAIEWLMEKLTDGEPWHAWSNFEFMDEEGKVKEVDVLVLVPTGLFLVEIKSRPGILRGDAHTWTWISDGRESSYDHPVDLATRKSKRLASLLRERSSCVTATDAADRHYRLLL